MINYSSRQTTLNSQNRFTGSHHLVALATLVIFGLTGVWYSLVVPPFETPDELYHYGFARHLAQGNGLPVQNVENPGPWEQEGSQAPLYYQIVGWLTSSIDQSDFDQMNYINERSNIGDPLFPGNKNRMLYSTADRPLQGTNLAMHVGRWFSIVLGLITLMALYGTGRLALPHRPSVVLLALLVVATIPQFVFISASLSNDTLIIAASAVTIYWLMRLVVRPLEQPIAIWEWLILGVLLGIAALSKLQGLGLWLLAALVGLILAWLRRDWRLILRAALPVALPAIAICGWWYWRNYTLYNDWLGVRHLIEINGLREKPITWGSLPGELRGLRYSFWGIFGWFNILLPIPIYTFLDLTTLLAVGGLPLAWFQERRARRQNLEQDGRGRGILLLTLWALLSLALLVYWSSQAMGSQGRLLFPGITAFGLLFAVGLIAWGDLIASRLFALLPSRLEKTVRRVLYLLLPLLLLGSSLYALLALLPISYRAPMPVAQIPTTATATDITYVGAGQDRLRLVALEVGPERYSVGDLVPITLYLTADEVVEDDYQLFVQFLDREGVEVANLTSHPGWGRNPTSLWTPGQIYADSYVVRVMGDTGRRSPLLAQVYTGFVNPTTEKSDRTPIDALDSAGNEIVPMVETVALEPSQPPDLTPLALEEANTHFGEEVVLTSFALHELQEVDELSVTLIWDAIGTPAADYVAYVHLLDDAGNRVAGFDQPPAADRSSGADRFPTSHWRAQDRIVSDFTIALPTDLPTGTYSAWVGLYDAASEGADRLPIADSGGLPIEHNQVRIGDVQIEK